MGGFHEDGVFFTCTSNHPTDAPEGNVTLTAGKFISLYVLMCLMCILMMMNVAFGVFNFLKYILPYQMSNYSIQCFYTFAII